MTGGKLVLNGGYVQFDSFLVPTNASYSVALDFQLTNATDPGIVEFISQGYSGGPGFYIGTQGFGFRATDSWYGPGPNATYDPAVAHNVLLSVDSDAGKSYFYLDGVLRDTRNLAITTTSVGSNTRFGSQFSPYGELLYGTLDNLRIYNAAITPDQNLDGAQAPEPSTFLLGGFAIAAAAIARRRASNALNHK